MNERRNRTVARWPDRRAHPFWSPWDDLAPYTKGTMTKCEHCGVYRRDHPDAEERPEPALRPRTTRMFDFDPATGWGDALRTIRAALDDEGLALSDSNTTGDRVTSVLTTVDGRRVKRMVVPPTRIVAVSR